MKLWGALVFLIGSMAAAQEVVPLFRNDSLTTYVTMPFRLQDDNGQAISIVSIEITSSKENCQGMIDPKISSNFLVKCTKEGALGVDVYFRDASGSMMRIVYNDITVTKISDSATVLQPVTEDPDKYKAGRDLFATYCMKCHQAAHDKANKSVTQIKSAITNIGSMKSIKLTDAQIKSISDYLNNLD